MRADARPIDDRGTPARGRRGAACAAAALILAAPIAGCGGGSPGGGVASLRSHTSSTSSTASTGSTAAGPAQGRESSPGSQAVAYAACMRSHGVTGFPDPVIHEGANGASVKMAVPASAGRNPRFKSAQQACQKLLPNGGAPGGQPTVSPQEQAQYLRAAACIRSHGVPNFPDPTFSGGGVHIDHKGLNLSSPTLKAAIQACKSVIPEGAQGTHPGSAHEAAP
ncbi:MAG TPA: hypothetical protein VL979_03715 [Solirubrobacteraceae bacterium]|nr:hypothetical protein [Solirubrobacteraceae bacterium]